MRIVQLITRPQRRGAEIFAVQLAAQLLLLGHEVTVISILEGTGGLEFSGEFIQLNFKGKSKLDLKGFRKLAGLLKKIKPDIVQANAADTLLYAVGARLMGAGDFSLLYRNANTISRFIKSKRQLLFNKLLHSKVDAVISVSQNSQLDYQKLFSPKNIVAIPIGIDPVEIELKMGSNLTFESQDYLLFAGSLVPEKDPLGMLAIFSALLKTNPDLRLKFLGSGPLEAELRIKINSEVLGEFVGIIPNQSNVFPILSKAKALLMPSKIEGLPGVILEAMYCKVPVVAYNVGGIGEVLKNGETGWLVEAENSGVFKENILEVLNSPTSELERITSAAKALVLKNYQIDQIAKEFERFYCSVIANAETKTSKFIR